MEVILKYKVFLLFGFDEVKIFNWMFSFVFEYSESIENFWNVYLGVCGNVFSFLIMFEVIFEIICGSFRFDSLMLSILSESFFVSVYGWIKFLDVLLFKEESFLFMDMFCM